MLFYHLLTTWTESKYYVHENKFSRELASPSSNLVIQNQLSFTVSLNVIPEVQYHNSKNNKEQPK